MYAIMIYAYRGWKVVVYLHNIIVKLAVVEPLSASLDTRLCFESVCVLRFCFFFTAFWQNAVPVHVLFNEQ